MGTLAGIGAVFVLVFLNGFFVAAEFSLVGARRTRIAQLAEEGSLGAKAAQQAMRHLDNYIAATQLGITLASLALGWIGEPAVAHLFEPLLHLLPGRIADAAGHGVSVALAFALVTMLHIILGELAPKSIALQRPEATAVIVARPTTWFLKLFNPVIHVMNAVGNGVVRLLGFEPAAEHHQVHSAEELEMLVHSSQEAGLIEESEELLLRRAFDFPDILVREVMQPRVEVEAFDIDTPVHTLLQRIAREHHHSRYPIYRGSIDNVVGVLHTKDLLDAVVEHPELLTDPNASFDLQSLLREPLYLPAVVRVDEVLERMQRTKKHLAVVLDEYGGVAGIATMEDILEELVGEVQDEFDIDELMPIEAREGMAVVDGLTSLNELIERFGPPDGSPQSATIGGYVAEQLERIPEKGDVVRFGEYDVIVEEMDEMRVARVCVVKRNADAPGTASDAEQGVPEE